MFKTLLLLMALLLITTQSMFAQETVEVLKLDNSDKETYSTCIAVTVPAELCPKTQMIIFRENGFSVETMPFEGRTSSNNSEHSYNVRNSKPGDKIESFLLYVKKRKDVSSAVIRIEDRRYPIELSEVDKLGKLSPKKRNEYGALEGMFSAEQASWTRQTQERVLRATVRITAPSSKGSGTMVEVPEELSSLVGKDEVLVATAAHVAPAHLRAKSLYVETFTYDANFRATLQHRFPAEIVVTTDESKYPDIAFVKFSPKTYKLVRVPLARPRRWLSRRYRYYCVGCPNGNLPQASLVEVLQVARQRDGVVVTTDKKSIEGESGGGLFDPDGYLLAVRAVTSDQKSLMMVGTGMLDAPEEGEGQRLVEHSHFWHASSARQHWPTFAADYYRKQFEESISILPSQDQQVLRSQFEQMLQARFK